MQKMLMPKYGRSLIAWSLLLLIASAIAITAAIAVIRRADTALPTDLVWFSGRQSQGLRQDSSNNLIAMGSKLRLERRPVRLSASAYYPRLGVLVTVDEGAVTTLYEAKGGVLKTAELRPPNRRDSPFGRRRSEPVRTRLVRFSNVPGLLYVTWEYPELSRSMSCIQVATVFTERLAMGRQARKWHAVLYEDSDDGSLEQVYEVAPNNTVHLFTSQGKKAYYTRLSSAIGLNPYTTLRLPEPLAESSPYPRWEAVTIIPNRVIICETRRGWSLHNLDGRRIAYCSGLGKGYGWHLPFYRNGNYYVNQVTCGYSVYRMDFQRGKLVYFGSRMP
jgi:hypothetical protein